MPFWRRRTEEPAAPVREVDEPVDPDFVDPSWEPDPADFADPAGGTETRTGGRCSPSSPTRNVERVDPLLPFEAPPPTVMTISIPTPLPTPEHPVPSWAEPVREPEPVPAAPAEVPSDTASALDAGLQRTRGGFMARLRGQLGTATGEGPSWDDVEESLIAGDVGAALAIDLVERARRNRDAAPEAAIRTELAALLVARDLAWSPRSAVPGGPAVVLVVGVNGTGKTTTIGKLASRYSAEGRSVLLAAADTFRAAAIDQLRIWADRAKVPMVAHAPGADPGAVVYDALDAAVARGADLVIADTAGRLHTRSNLMDELTKVRRIIDKRLPGAEPETIFVLDATTGQNGLSQAKAFHEAVGLTGIVLTKLDSTAKGGIVFAIEDALKIPVRFVGVGEGVNDLHPVRPRRVRGGPLRLTVPSSGAGRLVHLGRDRDRQRIERSLARALGRCREHQQVPDRREPQDRRHRPGRRPGPATRSHAARSPRPADPAPIVATSWARTAATWNVDETRPSARSRTSVWRTETSVMS